DKPQDGQRELQEVRTRPQKRLRGKAGSPSFALSRKDGLLRREACSLSCSDRYECSDGAFRGITVDSARACPVYPRVRVKKKDSFVNVSGRREISGPFCFHRQFE